MTSKEILLVRELIQQLKNINHNLVNIMATQSDLTAKLTEVSSKVDAAAERVIADIAAQGDTQGTIDALTAIESKVDAIAPSPATAPETPAA